MPWYVGWTSASASAASTKSGVALASGLAGDVGGEAQEGAALVLRDRRQQPGTALEVEPRVGPRGLRDRSGELQEGPPVLRRERPEQLARALQAGRGELVRALREPVEDLDQVAHGVQRQRVQQRGALLEEGGGERDGFPVASREPPSEGGPGADLLAGAADPLAHDPEILVVGALQRL